MNRRCKKLDDNLGEKVRITFKNGTEKTGILEFGEPFLTVKSDLYSLLTKDGRTFFRKSVVKNIRRTMF